MRVVWKDSIKKGYTKKYVHRGYALTKLKSGGWITDHPGDRYIYSNAETAQNALDEMLGGVRTKRIPARIAKWGIRIIGEKDGTEE